MSDEEALHEWTGEEEDQLLSVIDGELADLFNTAKKSGKEDMAFGLVPGKLGILVSAEEVKEKYKSLKAAAKAAANGTQGPDTTVLFELLGEELERVVKAIEKSSSLDPKDIKFLKDALKAMSKSSEDTARETKASREFSTTSMKEASSHLKEIVVVGKDIRTAIGYLSNQMTELLNGIKEEGGK